MKTYVGRRIAGECVVTVDNRPLRKRTDLRNHSPTGFEWGYAGSGPAQLALAILADASGNDELALSLYQAFKSRIVTRMPESGWVIGQRRVLQWIEKQRAKGLARPQAVRR
jgi:hypothetical protein